MGKERNGSLTETNGNTRREPKRQGSTELYDMATKVTLLTPLTLTVVVFCLLEAYENHNIGLALFWF